MDTDNYLNSLTPEQKVKRMKMVKFLQKMKELGKPIVDEAIVDKEKEAKSEIKKSNIPTVNQVKAMNFIMNLRDKAMAWKEEQNKDKK